MKQEIIEIKANIINEENGDTSYLGEYKNEPDYHGWYVDRKEDCLRDGTQEGAPIIACNIGCNYNRGEDRYIVNFQHHGGLSSWSHVNDIELNNCFLRNKLSKAFKKFNILEAELARTRPNKIRVLDILYCCQAAERLSNYGKTWDYVSVCVSVKIVRDKNGVSTIISAPSLGGIESDSEDYIKEIIREQVTQLKAELKDYGFSIQKINTALKSDGFL
jgi:hypothetical protein